MITLSFSTLDATEKCNQYWLNKMQRLETVDFPWFQTGKKLHNIIQEHVSGKKEDKRLTNGGITLPEFKFPIVEEKDFDERLKFTIKIDENYEIIGFLDGIDPKRKRFLEIKPSNVLWSLRKFLTSPQRKIYAWAFPDFKEMVGISCEKKLIDPKETEVKVKSFILPLTKKDIQEAKDWVNERIKIIEEGKFDGGSDINCSFCVYNESCPKAFK